MKVMFEFLFTTRSLIYQTIRKHIILPCIDNSNTYLCKWNFKSVNVIWSRSRSHQVIQTRVCTLYANS